MTAKHVQIKEKNRQVYEKPRLRTINLLTQEVLATGCKTDVSGPNEYQLGICQLTDGCRDLNNLGS